MSLHLTIITSINAKGCKQSTEISSTESELKNFFKAQKSVKLDRSFMAASRRMFVLLATLPQVLCFSFKEDAKLTFETVNILLARRAPRTVYFQEM